MSKDLDGLWHLPDNVGRLPFRVKPRELEPAESILYRLALANGFSTVQRMLHSTPNFPNVLSSYAMTRERSIALAVRLGDLPREPIEAATPHRTRRRISVFGHHFLKFRRVYDARVCPLCIAHDKNHCEGRELLRPYRRNWWEIHSLGACAIHAVPLVGRCPKCRKGMTLTGSAAKCDCDPRTELWRTASQVVPEEDMVHDRWLLGRLGIVEKLEHSFLDSLTPDVGSRLCLIIGNIIERQFNLSSADLPRPGYSVRARSHGWRVLQNWPHSFHDFLDRLFDRDDGTGQTDTKQHGAYGGLNRQLMTEGSPELKVVLKAVRDHKRYRLAAAKMNCVRSDPAPGERVALYRAARLVDCRPKRFLELCRVLEISPLRTSSGAQMVSSEEINVVKKFLDTTIKAPDARKMLGCGTTSFENLIKMGMLRVRFGGPTASRRIDLGDLETLLESISKPIDEINEPALSMENQAAAAMDVKRRSILKRLAKMPRASGRLIRENDTSDAISARS